MRIFLLILLLLPALSAPAEEKARFVQTPYEPPKVLVEFYFDNPDKINSALYWIRALMSPLLEEPYNMAPEFFDIVVVIHGTEIVTTVKHNYEKYKDAVERMRYYASLGVKFRVCSIAAADFGYKIEDFHEFIELVPSAMTELVHWQQQGYAYLLPQVFEKRFNTEEIR